jgi:hypothetical protein
MTKFFCIIGYEQQQHYRDRGPTWIKLYNRLLDDYGFAHLSDPAKWHLIGIQLQASRHSNRIPADPAWLARQIGAHEPIDLDVLEQGGFIAFLPDVVSAFENSGNPASAEKRREEGEGEGENNNLSAVADPSKDFSKDFEEFWSGYPKDPLMSKKRTNKIWKGMDRTERAKAIASLPNFRAFVSRQKDYRTLHAWKYLIERRYEGFEAPEIDEAAVAAAKDRADRLLKRGKYAEKYE